MSGIFISYRREDSIAYAGRLYDHLAAQFGEERIFMDIDTMKLGRSFVKQLEDAVSACDVLIAVIGENWLTVSDEEGHRRIDNPRDFVRIEIKTALERDIPVIPLFVGGAMIPKATSLPDDLENFAERHGMEINDTRFRADATRLIEQITEYVTGTATKGQPISAPKGKPRSKPKGKSASTPKSKITATPKGKPAIPEGMVLIPKGPFLYGERKKKISINHDYYMDMYPMTNKAYKKFIGAGGYKTQKYWSDEGWTWKENDHVNRPEFWTDSIWNQADHPVVGVSYYEAEAYASWAGKRLPTEQEWEKAARGTDGRKYPWGNAFDTTKCNSGGGCFDATTPVTTYPKGISPSGCFDMAGNVWEWCASWYDADKDTRVLRGGSWYTHPSNLRSAYRYRYAPTLRGAFHGVRCAQDAR